MKILVTGGAGFIGSAVCRHIIENTNHTVINVDKLTYAASLSSLRDVEANPRYFFEQADIGDQQTMGTLLAKHRVDAIMNLAAESHVDRSIDGPADFIETNIVGTYRLLEAARDYYNGLSSDNRDNFRFHHVSTDEVFGDLPLDASLFDEDWPYDPSSPYSASKAASDHLVRSWGRTFKLPVLLTNCSNNYGPYHFPEKLIPLIILNCKEEKPLPVYGAGENVRDWLYVDDHARALLTVLLQGKVGRSYNVGGRNERSNIDVVKKICSIMDDLKPRTSGEDHASLITHVADRPGHDVRYAIDASRLEEELGWKAEENFDSGIEKTVRWYLDNEWWWKPLQERYDGDRLGHKDG